jgi:hypothetical protein
MRITQSVGIAVVFGLTTCCVALAAPASVEDALPRLSPAERAELRDAGELTRFFGDDDPLALVPATALRHAVRDDIEGMELLIGVEALFAFDPPAALAREPEQGRYIYNVLRSVSTLEGIEYYSASRKRMRTFFYESYAIATPDSREPLPDPTVQTVPEKDAILVYQRDSSMGANVSRLTYRYTGDAVAISIENLTMMHYYLVPLVAPGNLHMHLMVIPGEEEFLFYGVCGVKAHNFLGLAQRKRASFYNRIKAMYAWFVDELTTGLETAG